MNSTLSSLIVLLLSFIATTIIILFGNMPAVKGATIGILSVVCYYIGRATEKR